MFINQKRQQHKVKCLITLLQVNSLLQKLKKEYDVGCRRHKDKINSLFICVKMMVLFKRHIRQSGGSLDRKHKDQVIRPSMTVAAVLAQRQVNVQATKLMLKFMKFSESVHQYKQKVLTTFRQIEFIQKQFRSRYLAHSAKMQTLLKCWNSAISRLQIESQLKKDKQT